MNLRDLHYIVAVAEHRSFSKAAECCAISQPTLSNQIKKLEEYLGVQIFDRDPSNITLTPIGLKIIEIAKKITLDTETIKSIAKMAKHINHNKLIMGGFPTLASYVFPEYVFRLKQNFDDLKITIIEEKTDNLIEMLVSSKIDVALIALPVNDNRLVSVNLFDDEFYVAVSDDHAFASKTEIDLDELVNEKLLLLDEGHCLRTEVLKLCSATHHFDDDFRAASLETLRVMVKNGVGVTLMPSISIYPEESDIKYIPIRSNPRRTIGLFWKENSPRSEFFKKIASILTYKPIQDEF